MKFVKQSFEFCSQPDGRAMLNRIELAGRTCYKSEDKVTADSARKFVAMVLKRGHESVIEHEFISVRIICDRGITHELVRHRLASYSQESTRYCNYGKANEITVIEPPELTELGRSIWHEAMLRAENAYMELLRDGATPQIARSVLPNSLKTEIVMTCNLREWRHFFKLRTAGAAHPQMRQLARHMLAEFRARIPVIFDECGAVDDFEDMRNKAFARVSAKLRERGREISAGSFKAWWETMENMICGNGEVRIAVAPEGRQNTADR
jgi:thymidylate synthase (FAD)